jgi:hypothetical protein
MATSAVAVGCFSPSNDAGGTACDPAPESEVEQTRAALYGAMPSSELAELDRRGRNAIVAIVIEHPVTALCTGVLLTSTMIASAEHCVALSSEPPEVRIGDHVDSPEWSDRPRRVMSHPSLDLALIELGHPVPADLATPLPLLRSELDLVGRHVELAGFGLTENSTVGARLFTTEIVVDDDGEFVTVDGEGQSGACQGDSGGPLLMRDAQFGVRVVGVLSRGSASCVDLDQYVPVHRAIDWIDEMVARSCDS